MVQRGPWGSEGPLEFKAGLPQVGSHRWTIPHSQGPLLPRYRLFQEKAGRKKQTKTAASVPSSDQVSWLGHHKMAAPSCGAQYISMSIYICTCICCIYVYMCVYIYIYMRDARGRAERRGVRGLPCESGAIGCPATAWATALPPAKQQQATGVALQYLRAE